MFQVLKDFSWQAFHILFRYFNFPHELGLITIGNPGPEAPVFISGNYSLTVKRLQNRLRGRDCFLLVANSRGSNVWCAAGMNEFTEHDLVDAINVSNLYSLVNHRRIIVPVYAAVGIDCAALRSKTGFNVKWGPTHLNDLDRYIDNDCKRSPDMYDARFELWDRVEQALSTSWSYGLTIVLGLFIWPVFILKALGLTFVVYLLVYCFLPLLPEERQWRRSAIVCLGLAAAMLLAGLIGQWSLADLLIWEAVLLIIVLLLVTDLCGSTPLYKSTIKHWLLQGDYSSDFSPVIDPDLCINCIQCILVCPRNVFAAVRGELKTVVAVNPGQCEECLACLKQCPTDAIYSRVGTTKGDIKSIENLSQLVTRDHSHLRNEDHWIGRETSFRKNIPVVLE